MIPTQLKKDVETVARAIEWHPGEIITLALYRFLEAFVPMWNERSLIKIPELPSLAKGSRRPITMTDILNSLHEVNQLNRRKL
jgi:hypothetical protein